MSCQYFPVDLICGVNVYLAELNDLIDCQFLQLTYRNAYRG